MALIWTLILVTSLITVVGFGRAGSQLFWKSYATTTGLARPEPKREPLAFTMVFALMAALVLMTVFAGPVTDWLSGLSAELFARTPYIDAVLHSGKE